MQIRCVGYMDASIDLFKKCKCITLLRRARVA
jgi:hypothetical protein